MASVHFWGVDNVVKAYEQRNVDSWAVFQGSKQMLNKGNTKEDLLEYLKTLWQDSTAVFTLNFYETEIDSVKPSTPNDGSFNFKLSSTNHSTAAGVGGSESLILSKLNAMELRLEQYENDDLEPEETEPDTWEKIAGLLEKPAIVGLINKFTGLNMQPMGKVGNVSPGPHNEQEIAAAIEVLKTKDPFLGKHLTKLATMATTNPANFNFLLQTLDSLP